MWGEILEEDLYDENTPFYDEDLVLKEQEARLKKMQEMEALHPNMKGDRKLKRKVIYVYEKQS